MKRFKIGLQLYSVAEEMERDMEATLKEVAKMGYDCVELAKNFFGYPVEEVKKACEKYGLEPVSTHYKFSEMVENPTETLSKFQTMGIKYAAVPFVLPDVWIDDREAFVAKLEKACNTFKENGVQLMYHNHDHELLYEVEGMPALDWLYEKVDLLSPQFDICWVHYAGKNPYEYIKKYGDRQEILHLKDFECENLPQGNLFEIDTEIKFSSNPERRYRRDMEADGFIFKPVGYGRQDVAKILKTAEDTNIKYIIVEQDMHPERGSLEDAKLSIDYIRSLGY